MGRGARAAPRHAAPGREVRHDRLQRRHQRVREGRQVGAGPGRPGGDVGAEGPPRHHGLQRGDRGRGARRAVAARAGARGRDVG